MIGFNSFSFIKVTLWAVVIRYCLSYNPFFRFTRPPDPSVHQSWYLQKSVRLNLPLLEVPAFVRFPSSAKHTNSHSIILSWANIIWSPLTCCKQVEVIAITETKSKPKVALRRKNFEGICARCGHIRPLQLSHLDQESKTLSLKCKVCNELTTFPLIRVLKSGRVLSEAEYEERKKALATCIEYTPQQTYWIGQEIQHQRFQDKGTVVKKLKSDGGHHFIIVKFEKSGEKTLIEGADV